MVTKAIVEQIVTPYSIKVRIPLFDSIIGQKGATQTIYLNEASICSLPNTLNQVNIGDIVYVAFEDNDISKPVIIGHLYKDSADATYYDLSVRIFNTTSNTHLCKDTWIGDVNPEEINMLKGVNANLQNQLDDIKERLTNLERGN